MEARATLKGYFETGDKPTQAQFGVLIDSVPNLVDDSSEYTEIILKNDVIVGATSQDITILAADSSSYFLFTRIWFMVISQTGTTVDNTKSMSISSYELSYFEIESASIYPINPDVDHDLSSALQIHCDELPSGITALTVRILCKGIKVSKT